MSQLKHCNCHKSNSSDKDARYLGNSPRNYWRNTSGNHTRVSDISSRNTSGLILSVASCTTIRIKATRGGARRVNAYDGVVGGMANRPMNGSGIGVLLDRFNGDDLGLSLVSILGAASLASAHGRHVDRVGCC